MMPGKIFVIVVLFMASCVQCSSVHVCNGAVLLNNSSDTSVPIAVDCSELQCEDLSIKIGFFNNKICSWTMNGDPYSPLLIPHSKTDDSVRVNLTAMCLDGETPALLQCNIFTPIYILQIQVPIYNSTTSCPPEESTQPRPEQSSMGHVNFVCLSDSYNTSDEGASDETPSDEGTSDGGTSDETPSDEVTSDETPSDEGTSDETPSDEVTSDETPSDEGTSDKTPSDEGTSDETPSDEVTSDETPSDKGSSANWPPNYVTIVAVVVAVVLVVAFFIPVVTGVPVWIVRRRRSGRGSGPNNGGHRECDNESGTQKEEIKMDSFGGGSTSNQLGSGSSEGVPYSVNVVENCLHKTRTLVFEDTSVEENDKIVQNDEISFQCSGDSIWSSFDKMDVHFDTSVMSSIKEDFTVNNQLESKKSWFHIILKWTQEHSIPTVMSTNDDIVTTDEATEQICSEMQTEESCEWQFGSEEEKEPQQQGFEIIPGKQEYEMEQQKENSTTVKKRCVPVRRHGPKSKDLRTTSGFVKKDSQKSDQKPQHPCHYSASSSVQSQWKAFNTNPEAFQKELVGNI